MNKLKIPVKGMHCASCEILVGENLKKIPGVKQVKVDQKKGEAEIQYENQRPSDKQIRNAVQEAGYDVGQKEKLPWISSDSRDYTDLLRAGIILFLIYLVAKWAGVFNLSVESDSGGVLVSLLVGLVAGVSTCMALIGGLLLGLSARHAELHPEATSVQKFRPHIYFNIGRILGYAFFGGVIGLIGSAFSPSANLLGFLTMVVGGVMIFFGLKLIEIFPILKDKSITLPSGIARIFGLNKEVTEYSPKSSMVMGALTFFLPCGFTQAMQIYAVSTGSFWSGMAVMGLFAVGTAPGLLGIGGLTSFFKGRRARVFFMAAGLAVIVLGWFNIANGSQLISGKAPSDNVDITNGDYQEVRMTQSGSGYNPKTFTVVKGKPVKWIIDSKSSFSCSASIVMPKYGISQGLRRGENVIVFTPKEVGEIPFSCSMGMYRGKFIVTDSEDSAALPGVQVANATQIPEGNVGSCGAGGGGCGGCGGGGGQPVEKAGTVNTINVSGKEEQVIKSTYTYNDDLVPNTFTVKKGKPVKFVIDVKEDGEGCMGSIMIPELYNDPKWLSRGELVMSFTPEKTGEYDITCAMGVPRGRIIVVN